MVNAVDNSAKVVVNSNVEGSINKAEEVMRMSVEATTPHELAKLYFENYNTRNKKQFRELFDNEAEMIGVTVVVKGGDEIANGCFKLWEEDVEYPKFIMPETWKLNPTTVDNSSEEKNKGTVYCEVCVQMKRDSAPPRICDVIECTNGKIIKLTAYLGQKV